MEAQLATSLNEWCLSNTRARLLPNYGPTPINTSRDIHSVKSKSLERNSEPTDAISIPWIQPQSQHGHDIYKVPRTQEDILETTPSPLSLPSALHSTETSPSCSALSLPSTGTNTNISTGTNTSINTNASRSPPPPPPPPTPRKRGRPRLDLSTNTDQRTHSPSRAARLLKGRLAARRHRERHGQKIEHLQDLYTWYAEQNTILKGEVKALKEEVLGLKDTVLRHAGCGFGPIEKYVVGQTMRFVDA